MVPGRVAVWRTKADQRTLVKEPHESFSDTVTVGNILPIGAPKAGPRLAKRGEVR